MRRTPIIALSLSVAALAAACGSGSGAASSAPAASAPAPADASAAAERIVADAMDATIAAGTARFTTSATFGVPGDEITMSGSGVYAFDGSAAAIDWEAEIPGQPAIAMEMLVRSRNVYISSPMFDRLTGGRWLMVPADRPATLGGVDLRGMGDDIETSSPAYALAFLAGAEKVTRIGVERIGGVEVTRYGVVVNIARVQARATDFGGQAIERGLRGLRRQLGSPTIDIDVWIDGEGLIRRQRMEMEMVAEGVTMPSVLSTDLVEHGAAVRVAAPAHADIVAVTELS